MIKAEGRAVYIRAYECYQLHTKLYATLFHHG